MAIKQQNPETLPPSPFIRKLAEHIDYGQTLDVLDIGCCMGRNAIYMANQGHRVVGIDKNIDDLLIAKKLARGKVMFVAADARQLMFSKMFDVIMANEVLHQMTKPEARQVLKSLTGLTRPGGIHLVSDYIADKPSAMAPFEIFDSYDKAHWEIIEYSEDPVSFREHGGVETVDSLAMIAAMRK